jgi:hypothetical protein
MNVAAAMLWIVETACKLTDVQLPYCPLRTSTPTRAPLPVPVPAPTKPKPGPTKVVIPSSNCWGVDKCAAVIRQECGCPTIAAPKTRCLKRAVKQRCCASTAQIRTAYYLQAQQAFRTRSCGLTS